MPVHPCELHREPWQPCQIEIGVLLAAVLVGDGAGEGFKITVDIFIARPEGPPPVQLKIRFHIGGIAHAFDDVGGMELIEPYFTRYIAATVRRAR